MIRSLFPIRPWLILGLIVSLWLGEGSLVRGADSPETLPYDEAIKVDVTAWRELLRKGEYDALEKIADDLRTTNSKYRMGRSRLWRFAWLAFPDNHNAMTEEDFTRAFDWLDGWRKARPDSVNVRLVQAHVFIKYAHFGRGNRPGPATSDRQLSSFEDRCKQAASTLDEVAGLEPKVDNVYRRLRIDLSMGLRQKPDVNLVYDALKDDPTSTDVVHGMSICLLPRWFGKPGELEEFADEVVRRTKDQCGEMQYTTVAIASKEFLKAFLLDSHAFDWKRLQQGFRDLERVYPLSTEHFNDEAQLAYMAGDLEAVYAAMAKIGDRPQRRSWEGVEINFDRLRQRITPEMMAGDQKRSLLGHTNVLMAVQAIGNGEIAVTADWNFAVRIYDAATGTRRSWVWLRGLLGESVAIHPKTALLSGGSEDGPGILIYSVGRGRSGQIPFSEAKVVETTFSPEGDLLAAADQEGRVIVIDLKGGKPLHEFPAEKKREIRGLAFSSD